MHAKELKHIIKRRCKALEESVHEIQKGFHKDAIHAFRVQVKKLRSFLRAIGLKLPKKIKKVYASAGQIRDIQLQVKEIAKACKQTNQPGDYLALLASALKKRKMAFETISKKNHFQGIRKKLYKKLPAKLPYKNICQFLHHEIAVVLALINTGLSEDNDLHNTRKKIKDIIYINDIYKEALQRCRQPELLNEQSLKKATALADELGKFIDKQVSISLIKPGWLKQIDAAERKQLQSISQRWGLQKQALRKNVSGKLRSAGFRKLINKQ